MVLPRVGRRLEKELRPENVASFAAGLPDGVRGSAFAHLLHRIDQGPVLGGNRVEVFFQGAEAFASMCRSIDAARAEILLESYILKDDETGCVFLEALASARARGVEVKVLADFFGSFATRRRFWAEMRRRGIEVRLFNPLFPHIFLQPFRDHRKILVIDRRIGFTGGMNIGDEYGSTPGSRRGPWRDTHARVEGSAAWEMATVFSEAWHRSGGSRLALEPLEKNPQAPAAILTLDSRPGRGHGETASALTAMVAAARQRVWITNAYFAPRARAVSNLAAAAKRGVDVRLLLPGRSDVPLVRHAGHGYYASLLRRGIRIFEYEVAILHAKTLVADDFVSVVGSSNLDFRSFHFNAECNLVILDEPIGKVMAAAFEGDLKSAREITAITWHRRKPLHALGDRAARLLAPVL